MVSLATVYIIALIVGGGLILISSMLGSHGSADIHADLSGGLGADHGLGGDEHHGANIDHDGGHRLSLASWFSIQFAVFFLAIFGLIGTTLTYVAQVEPTKVLAASAIGGLLAGQVVHQALRVLKRSGVGSDLTTEDYVNQPARVTVALDASRRGEVALASRNGERFLAALARRRDDRFKVGDRVVVVGFTNGVAEVVSKVEHDFVTDASVGGNQ